MIFIYIKADSELTANEVVNLQKLIGWGCNRYEREVCLAHNVLNVSARDEKGNVVGVGFPCGGRRHAELVDLVVQPDYLRGGIGREITKIIINYALDYPWLKTFMIVRDLNT